MEERFPIVTYVLMIVNLTVYVFTQMNFSYFEFAYGFIPAVFKPYTLVTYMFLHSNLTHLVLNMIMLVVIGLAVEDVLGKLFFLGIYFSSGITATFFDILGRVIFNIPFSIPFIGASGAIFGLLSVACLIKPFEKIPTFLVIMTIVPLIMMLLKQDVLLANPVFIIALILFVAMTISSMFVIFPTMPFMLSLILYGVFWLLLIVAGFTTSVSYMGHIGGVVGGFLGFIFLAKRS